MRKEQKKYSHRLSFLFGEKELEYTMNDRTGSAKFTIDYAAIPFDEGEFEERVEVFWNLTWILGLISLVILLNRFMTRGSIDGIPWMLIPVITGVAYWLRRTRFTTLDAGKANVLIIQDEAHDEILSELKARRTARLRALHGAINVANNPSREIEKFEWLFSKGVISKQECDDAVSQIVAHHRLGAPSADSDRTDVMH